MKRCRAGQDQGAFRRFGLLLAAALAIVTIPWLGVAAAAEAQQKVITSPGPMTQITLGDDLTCQVQMANDAFGAFFDGSAPGACGTFMQVNQTPPANNLLFGPMVPGGTAAVTADFTPAAVPQSLTGNGTAALPYTVITTVDVCASGACASGAAPLATLTEVDTYVSGSDEYDTTLTIGNLSGGQLGGTLYHTGDCFLMGDVGYGAVGGPNGNAPECTLTPNDSPPGRIMSLIPGGGLTSNYFEGAYMASESPSGQSPGFWDYVTPAGTRYPNTIDATNNEDNGMGLSWPYSLAPVGRPGATTTIQYDTLVNSAPTNTAPPVISGSPAVGQVLTCSTGTWSGSGPITYTFQWMRDGNPIAVATSNTYTIAGGDQGHSLACQVTATNAIGSAAQTSASDHVPAVPTVSPQPPTVTGAQGATFAAAVNPNGSATTVHFEYGLDPKYGLTTASNLYVQQTPDQPVSSGFSPQVVIAGVTGLVPNALYHVRVVATNSIGTVTGADQTFKTVALPPPPAPVLGREANFTPTSGVVYIKAPLRAHGASLHANVAGRAAAARTRGKGFIPLTEALQFPVGTQVDARNGKLKVTTATASRKGKRTKTQSGEFSEGLFEVLQSGKRNTSGLTVLKLLDTGIFPGAPSYKTECAVAGKASTQVGEKGGLVVFKPRRLSHKVLQTLLAGEHGSYQTQGRYSAATVRGTTFTVSDRCDGTLTHVQRGTVVVNDFRQRRNITVHTGREYLAKAP